MRKLILLLALVSSVAYANGIDDKCRQHVYLQAPVLSIDNDNQYMCRVGYGVNYNYDTKVPY